MSSKRKCVFCGSDSKLSNEHIFAQWLLKELDVYDSDVLAVHSPMFGDPFSVRKQKFSNLVNGFVCEKCNNGWMSSLECECKPHIENLMSNNEDKIKCGIETLSENHLNIAKWVFKNAILLNSASNYKKIVPQQHYRDLFDDYIPANVFIDMAFSKALTKLSWRQSPMIMVIKDAKLPLNIDSDRYKITFVINGLLFKVCYMESNNKLFYESEGAIRLYPELGAIF